MRNAETAIFSKALEFYIGKCLADKGRKGKYGKEEEKKEK